MKNTILIFLSMLIPASALAQENAYSSLIINEVQVANIDQYLDNANCYGGWVELYNPTDSTIRLRNMHLTDGVNDQKFISTFGSVPAKGFKVIWFGHYYSEGNYGSTARLQMPFKLDPEGGTITLLDTDLSVLSSVDYPPSIPRCSWARTEDDGDEWDTTGEPTPEKTNATSSFASFRLEAPLVDTDSRVFYEDFTVRVNIPSGCTLRYTTDGSAPTLANGETSISGRFDISATTILRLCLFADGLLPSPVVTRSYIFANHDYYLPVLSVASEPKNFYDNKVGIFVKGTNGVSGNGQSSACNWNMDWERPVNFELLVPSEDTWSMVVNQEADIEICGGWTRAYGEGTVDGRYWPTRSSFRLKTDKRYEGVGVIDYPVFPLKPHNKYRCWQVRNGGNDTNSRSKDPTIQQIVLRSGFYVDCQDYQPAHVFLNGEYYGMLNIRESNNKHFAYSNYGIDFEDMDQFDLSNAKYNQKMGDNAAWMQLQSLAKQLSLTKSEEVYQEICNLLDIDEYVNYMALECYIGPTDWITNNNNIKGFRSRSDGKFHFVLFDTDSAFGTSSMLTQVLETGSSTNVDDLFRNLMTYDPFRRQFLDAFCIVDGSVFEPFRCDDIVEEIYDNTNDALSFEGRSTSTSLFYTISYAHNGTRITNLRNYYAVSYGIYADISANVPEARLSVNGQEIPTGTFGGYLFSYKGKPIELKAQAPAGYAFSGWLLYDDESTTTTLIPEGSEWMYYDRGSMDGYKWKEPSFNERGWRKGTAPFGFANEGYYMQENSVTKLDYGSTNDKRPTYYFRNTFNLSSPLLGDDVLTFDYQVDDGMMLYVNGHEVGGYYVASGSAYGDYTIDGHFERQEPYAGSITIPSEYLVVGENQIAVEVKNCSKTSSDMWFDASLKLTTSNQVLSNDETIDLHACFDNDSYVFIEATFTPITDEKQRLETGAAPLRINEVSAGNDIYINDYGKKADWLELYNTTDHDISLEGLYLSDNRSKPQKFQLQEGVVPAHGTYLIWCDGKNAISQPHAPFKLENADGACVSIQAQDGSWADCLQYTEQGKWQTFGRYPDGGNMATVLNQPTIDKSNKLGMMDFIALSDEDWQGTDKTITLELAQGWNWTSHNMAESVDKSRFLKDALCLQGQTDKLLFSDENGWEGSLQALEAAKGYKIRMQKAGSVTLRGTVYDVSKPVHLHRGWNWIGCPLYNATTLAAAFANYIPEEGDKLVGLDAFATYENGRWNGSLTTLQPGQSYLLYAANEQDFLWQSLSPMKSRAKRYAAPSASKESELFRALSPTFNVNIHRYPEVMTMVAKVKSDVVLPVEEQYCVGAFCGDECRGIGIMKDGLLFMNIHGEGLPEKGLGESVSFRLLTSDGETQEAVGTVDFLPQTQLGNIRDPHLLWFGNQYIPDEIKPAFASSSTVREVQYFNISGQKINNVQSSNGILIRKEIFEDGTTKVTKLFSPK